MMSLKKDRVTCKKCKSLTVATFKFCQNCGVENSLFVLSTPASMICTSFNDLDFNLITLLTTFIHSKYKPLKVYSSDDKCTKEHCNADDAELCVMLSLNKHYRVYKAKNYVFKLNKEYSLKYYHDVNYFSLRMNIDDPSKQLLLTLSQKDSEDVSILGNVYSLGLSYCTGIIDVSALGNVHTLDLGGCTGIRDVSALGNVHTLNLYGCTGIIDVSALGNVHTLNLSGCTGITDVST